MIKIIGLTLMFVSLASFAVAGTVQAPEIDASSGVAAVSLLAGGLLVLRGRRRKS